MIRIDDIPNTPREVVDKYETTLGRLGEEDLTQDKKDFGLNMYIVGRRHMREEIRGLVQAVLKILNIRI